MTLNQHEKMVGFEKSPKNKGLSPNFYPKSNDMMTFFVDFTLNSQLN
jgi:hypothetical protein